MRKQCRLYSLIIALCVLLFGCAVNTLPKETSDVRALDTYSTSEKEHQRLTANTFLQGTLGVEAGMEISLPDVGLYDVTVSDQVSCISDAGTVDSHCAYILADFRYETPMFHDSYLAVETENATLFYDLGNRSIDDYLYANDLNADGADEIIVHRFIDSFGGAGSYQAYVFTVENGAIQEIFCFDSFDTGYASEFLENGKLRITNGNVGYSTIVDISDRYSDGFFDRNGKGVLNIEISCDSFMEFVPEDVDQDGVFEIICRQYVSLHGHADGIGYAISTLKFNADSQMMEVIQAEFRID